ncbi:MULTISPECIES: hypothetical protein [Arthrobacter]|uniref:Prenyltransferase n=2 Tax=Arthrobacter TaxID=1663 RepID=A0ABU9KPY9_9MICC|nr:hypothetical protein [Arthrobacter sp. YJM1]MDP5228630.1 hypothetical protein [Arthrobacter sp. YJM1]
MTDHLSAGKFITGHARLLDRHRHAALREPSHRHGEAVIQALEAYRNPDGGYGWGLEPDLRSPESQVAGALHALEALADAWPAVSGRLPALLDWLESVTLRDGGLPFALPVADYTACAPFWVSADPKESSLQLTAAVVAQAHRLAVRDRRVGAHPWLARATGYCLARIEELDERPFAYVLSFSLQLLDRLAGSDERAAAQLERLGKWLPEDGTITVDGGAVGESLHLTDFAPEPGGPVRALFSDAAAEIALARLEREQDDDGGWPVDFSSYSEAAALEWRGYLSVRAAAVLRLNGR